MCLDGLETAREKMSAVLILCDAHAPEPATLSTHESEDAVLLFPDTTPHLPAPRLVAPGLSETGGPRHVIDRLSHSRA